MQALWFLHSASCLMLIDIYMKFSEDSLNSFQFIEQNNMPPNPKGVGET